MSPVRTFGPEAFLEAARHGLDMLERGVVTGYSAHYEHSNGIGRVGFVTVDGKEVDPDDLPDAPMTPPTAPGKGQK